jgi:hypothetical protein
MLGTYIHTPSVLHTVNILRTRGQMNIVCDCEQQEISLNLSVPRTRVTQCHCSYTVQDRTRYENPLEYSTEKWSARTLLRSSRCFVANPLAITNRTTELCFNVENEGLRYVLKLFTIALNLKAVAANKGEKMRARERDRNTTLPISVTLLNIFCCKYERNMILN